MTSLPSEAGQEDIVSAEYDLESFVDESIRVSRANSYDPHIFVRMRTDHGTVGAIERLVRSGDIQSGLSRLVEMELSEWSVEAAVLRFPDEFSEQDRQAAEWRLCQARKTAARKP